MRSRIACNDGWKYREDFQTHYIGMPLPAAKTVDLPHANVQLPITYANELAYQFVSTYQKSLSIEEPLTSHRVVLGFEGVAHDAKVYLDEHFVGHHEGGYTPFELDITDYLNAGRAHLLTVVVDARESLNMPPFGHVIDYLTYGGIPREVWLEIRPEYAIADVFVYGSNLLESPEVCFDVTLSEARFSRLKLALFDGEKCIAEQIYAVTKKTVQGTLAVDALILWSIDCPKRYDVEMTLLVDEHPVDRITVKTGFREALFKKDGFYLNGGRVQLIGLNRHQSFPFVGYAMPRRAQQEDARILKERLGLNVVRSSHYPPSRHFAEACDALGLLLFQELPGWQHIGDAHWKEVALKNIEEMILRDRNRPACILWGVRINESGDDTEFYAKTNALARRLDPTRQTAGVRFITHGDVQEDVLALNDFIHEGDNLPLRKIEDVTVHTELPYIVTEYAGHMYPTKSYDPEANRIEHAKRHLNVIHHAYGDTRLAGIIGWCAYDYHTHGDFGSGDRVCHHGVLDMFRHEKLAAASYASQRVQHPYLKISSHFNIGDHPKGFIKEALIFTNVDAVDVYRNALHIGRLYPAKDIYPHLPHPPIIMDWMGELLEKEEGLSNGHANRIKALYKGLAIYGRENLPESYMQYIQSPQDIDFAWTMYGKYVANWGSERVAYTFSGIQDGREVIVKKIGGDFEKQIRFEADDTTLQLGETYDVMRLSIVAVNEHGQRLPYAFDAFNIQVEGPLEVLGNTVVNLFGGVYAFWVRTVGVPGEASVTITNNDVRQTLRLTIKE
ncbi:MAG: glycoside hydrolase family 2 protein [Acholeplasmatales bacterium]|nr:MAG: glycoside hydrolase family 2 protein [Acholeplasmatales bacterium]